jgi:hypothetical protein
VCGCVCVCFVWVCCVCCVCVVLCVCVVCVCVCVCVCCVCVCVCCVCMCVCLCCVRVLCVCRVVCVCCVCVLCVCVCCVCVLCVCCVCCVCVCVCLCVQRAKENKHNETQMEKMKNERGKKSDSHLDFHCCLRKLLVREERGNRVTYGDVGREEWRHLRSGVPHCYATPLAGNAVGVDEVHRLRVRAGAHSRARHGCDECGATT